MSPTREYERGNPIGSGAFTREWDKVSGNFQVQDISASGLSVVAGEGFFEGDVLRVQLDITGILFEKTVHLTAKVVKKTLIDGQALYGLKITQIEKQDRVEIDEMIRYLNTFNENFSAGLVGEEKPDLGIQWLSDLSGKK